MFGEIRNAKGEKLDYTYHPGASGAKRIVVLAHGVTGNKDRPLLVHLAEGLSEAGVACLRLSFAGNGASEGRFEDSSISKGIEDLGRVLDSLNDFSVCYVGHSMGGAVGVLRASQDPRIKLLVSLAGMVHTRAFAEREFGEVKAGEGCMWDKPECPLSQAFMDDLRQIESVLDRAANVRVPWLLVHGTSDDVVPIQDSYDVFARANDPKQLVELEGADHVFDGEATETMVETVVNWMKGR